MNRSEHGMISLPPATSAKIERAYAIHRSNAVVALRCFNLVLARHHAAKTRQLVGEFAKYAPFSADAARRYIATVVVESGEVAHTFVPVLR